MIDKVYLILEPYRGKFDLMSATTTTKKRYVEALAQAFLHLKISWVLWFVMLML